MSLKGYIIIAIVTIIINLASVLNAAYGIWALVLLIFAMFQLGIRDSDKSAKDKKVYGVIHAFMLFSILLMSSIMGITSILMLYRVVETYLSGFVLPSIILSVIGLISFYYFIIRLLIEAINVIKKKGVKA